MSASFSSVQLGWDFQFPDDCCFEDAPSVVTFDTYGGEPSEPCYHELQSIDAESIPYEGLCGRMEEENFAAASLCNAVTRAYLSGGVLYEQPVPSPSLWMFGQEELTGQLVLVSVSARADLFLSDVALDTIAVVVELVYNVETQGYSGYISAGRQRSNLWSVSSSEILSPSVDLFLPGKCRGLLVIVATFTLRSYVDPDDGPCGPYLDQEIEVIGTCTWGITGCPP